MKSKQHEPIKTTEAALPSRRCPALWDSVPTRTQESGEVTRLTCGVCGWNEAYLILERVPEQPRTVKGGEHLAFKKRHRVGPNR